MNVRNKTPTCWMVPALLMLSAASAAAQQPAAAPEPAPVGPAGRLEIREIPARSLEGNRVGDGGPKQVGVYLPPGYDAAAAAGTRYPVVYLLHGIFDHPSVWSRHYELPAMLDDLIGDGRVPPLIVVMPDGGNRIGGGFYRNSPVSGNWADLIAEELVTFVDTGYRTLPERDSRAVTGHSMGGYGALHLVMQRPDVFGTAWAMSPCCLAAEEDLGQGNPAWLAARELDGPAALDEAIEQRDFYVVAAVGLLSAFLPDPAAPPLFIEHPFRSERGETLPDEPAYTRFVLSFPVHHVRARREALLSLRGLGLDYGTGEQFPHIPEGGRLFSQRLSELRIPHTFEVYDGDHRKRIGERLREVVFPWIGRHLAAAPATQPAEPDATGS